MLIYECSMLMLMLCKSIYARLTPRVLQVLHPTNGYGDADAADRAIKLENMRRVLP